MHNRCQYVDSKMTPHSCCMWTQARCSTFDGPRLFGDDMSGPTLNTTLPEPFLYIYVS